jgi:hypothetical protein
MVGVEVVGGIYSSQPPIQLLGQAAVDGRTRQSGAPPNIVRCASHVTQPLGSWRFRPLKLCLLVTPDRHYSLSGASSVAALTSARTVRALCIARRPLKSTIALASRCSAGAPDSPVAHRTVRWIIAERCVETRRWRVGIVRPWCTGHCPVAHRTVRCARLGFSLVSFAPFFLNPNLIFLLVCVEPLALVEYII